MNDISLRKSWGSYRNDEISRKIDIDENSSLGMAAPLFKSFMEVKILFTYVIFGEFHSLVFPDGIPPKIPLDCLSLLILMQ